jgi:hypothetical protein
LSTIFDKPAMDVSNEETTKQQELPAGQCRQFNAIQQKRGNIYGTAKKEETFTGRQGR